MKTALLLMAVVSPALVAQSTFHGGNARTGVYQSPGPVRFTDVKWSFTTGGPVLSSPAIANNLVFFGSFDNHLYAVDQQTGKLKWKFKTGRTVTSSPAIENGLVYFGSFDGNFYAVTADKGELKWKFKTGGEKHFEAKNLHGYPTADQTVPDVWDLFTSSPAVFNGRVYFGSGDGNVYALDAQSGALAWKFATKDVVHSSPAIADNTLYIGSWDSYLYALDATSGKEKWKFKTGEDLKVHNQQGIQSSPAVVDGVVYFGCRDSHVYAVEAASGKKLWEHPTNGSWVIGTPAVRDGVVYVGTSDSALFFALDARTGHLRYQTGVKSFIFSSAALAGDLAYVGAFNGRLLALELKSGRLVWQYETENARKDPLGVLEPDGTWNDANLGFLFYGAEDLFIDVFRRFSVGPVVSSPVVDQGVLYFGSADGHLYALE